MIKERDLILYQHDDQAKPSTEIADSYMADVLFPLLQYRQFLVYLFLQTETKWKGNSPIEHPNLDLDFFIIKNKITQGAKINDTVTHANMTKLQWNIEYIASIIVLLDLDLLLYLHFSLKVVKLLDTIAFLVSRSAVQTLYDFMPLGFSSAAIFGVQISTEIKFVY